MTSQADLLPILALARAGATARAWESFVEAGLADVISDPAVLTLKGRLFKDLARKAEAQARARLLVQSAKAYADAAALKPDSYALINAATMSLFAGQTGHMQMLANQVLALMQTGVGGGETAYWHAATRAEALLLMGDVEAATASLAEAIAYAPRAWEDHATTLRQFRQILSFQGQDCGWLSNYAPAASLYFSGMMGIAADDALARTKIHDAVAQCAAGFGFGALAAGADILIAEALIAQGAELHIILPAIPSVFKAVSVDPFGASWSDRFDALFETAASVQIISGGPALSMAAVEIAAQVAKGRATDNAERMESVAAGLSVAAADHLVADSFAHVVTLTPNMSATGQAALPAHKHLALIAIAANGNAEADEHRVLAFADLSEAAAELARIRRDTPATLAITLGVDFGSKAALEARRAQIGRMLHAAAKGTTTAGPEAAMALKAMNPARWTEPLGELPDASGAIDVFAISRG